MKLDNKQLKNMRSTVLSYYTDSIDIHDVDQVIDRYGQKTFSLGNKVLTVSGQLSEPRGNEREIVAALKQEGFIQDETLRLALPFGTSITTNQRVVTSGAIEWNVAHVSSSYTFTSNLVCLITRKLFKPDE